MVRRALLVSCLVTACADGPIDRTRVPTHDWATPTHPSVACVPVGGSKITVTTTGDSKISGELLAANDDELALLVADSQVVHLQARQIERAHVDLYSNGAIVGALTAWAAVATVSALFHGYYFAISGPAWAVVSTSVIAPVAADPGRFATVESGLGRLYEYARFPGGIPPGVADASLHAAQQRPCE